eukprot:CAMPEP_0183308330 /NCGR_PEP_ID=MMETSP0160_2-20130417/21398_1 /TAXON_ID=2839 ORGANISM="Odontella Sinensis, Strain Grunow 1884" /NCGR_SAMPLE_ID=MMETSP0160_2 /ASSEMBLY_ACC=CAM_ASM_000250 /LENGTH=207 /DNA_ID=CAMNT_0025472153 /DNA_START=1 /DNA_END=624 /DNA_ORIENTATION=+
MSDYDTFPLTPLQAADSAPEKEGGHRPGDQHSMPNGGDFTVYSVLPGSKKGVPCLMSGRAGEWTRMALNILEDGLNHPQEKMWTDFFALMDISGTYATRDDVVDGEQVLTGKAWDEKDCHITQGKRAVHFSHSSMSSGVLRKGETMNDRPKIAKSFLQLWRDRCPKQAQEADEAAKTILGKEQALSRRQARKRRARMAKREEAKEQK